MAGYIGSKSSVTLVDGYSEAEADAEFVNDPNGAITVDGGNVGINDTAPSSLLQLTQTSDDATGGLQIRNTADSNSIFIYQDGNVTTYDAGSSGEQAFKTGNAERMRIDSSGNVGIGNTSPATTLHVGDTSDSAGIMASFSNNGFTTRLSHGTSPSTSMLYVAGGTARLAFGTDSTERMRIDSSGNVLVGKSSANSDVSGFEANASGFTAATRSNGTVFVMDRLVSDGQIISFRKDNTTVGSIGVQNNHLTIGKNDTGLKFQDGVDGVHPWNMSSNSPRDNAIDLGFSSVRFDDIYATNGTIQTSDFNEKQDIASLTATEMLVGKRLSALFKTFRWKDSVASNPNARTHTGTIAQDVQAAFTAEGLDAGDYSLFISTTWWETQTEVPAVEAVAEVTDEDGNVTTEAVEAKDAYTRTDTYETIEEAPEGATERTRMGIRYPELLCFVGAYNEQRFASIEARLTALEAWNMSGYIGTQPVPQATQTRDSFTATSGQTSFATRGYTPNYLDVYLNGVKLASADYTATNGSDVVLASGAATGDILEVVAYTAFDTANVTGATNFTVTGAFTSVGIDDNADAVALTIDGSENVLIGQTTASSGTVGTSLRPDGRNFYCADGNYSAHFNRNSSDGAIAHFAKDDTIVGSIGCYAGSFGVGQGDTGIGFFANDNIVFPSTASALARDNAVDLGYTAGRFKDLYLSGGVYLGGTAAANKLEDYEEGTWTPVYVGSSSAGSYTYVENQGHYVRIGNQVTCWFNLTNITTSSTGSGVSQINGLPFAANFMAGFNSECVGNVTCHGWTGIDGDQCWPLVTDGQSYVRVYKMTGTNNDPSPVEPSHKVNNNSDIRGFVTYYIGG